MYSLYANDDDILYGIQKYIVDTEEEMKTLPNYTRAGSTAFVIETSTTYILNHSKEWKKIKSNSSAPGIGGIFWENL